MAPLQQPAMRLPNIASKCDSAAAASNVALKYGSHYCSAAAVSNATPKRASAAAASNVALKCASATVASNMTSKYSIPIGFQ